MAEDEDVLHPVVVDERLQAAQPEPVSYTHLRAHETVLDLVCRLLLEKKNHKLINRVHDL
mgnify:CR=1 FL=1